MIRKLLGLGALAVIAVAALLLVSVSPNRAVAAVNGVSIAPSTLNNTSVGGTTTSQITIDADDGAGDVQILVSAGTLGIPECPTGTTCTLTPGSSVLPQAAARTVEDQGIAAVPAVVDDPLTPVDETAAAVPAVAASNVDTINVTYTAPTTGPSTVTVTVIQGSSVRTATITVRGAAATVDFRILAPTPAGVSGSACTGTDVSVINAFNVTANGGYNTASLCAIVRDTAGTRLGNQAVVFTTTCGTITPPAQVTPSNGNSVVGSEITSTATCTPGTMATVTASSGGIAATKTLRFAGSPATCSLTPTPGTIGVGNSSTVKVDVLDAATTPGPVADGIRAQVEQVNSGAGMNAAVLNSPVVLANGTGSVTVIAAIAGQITLGATVPFAAPGATTVSCTASVMATSTVVGPTATPGTGTCAGTITGDLPPRAGGGVALFVFNCGTVAQLVTASGCPAATSSFYVTSGGVFLTYVPGTNITAVNADFLAKFPGGNIPANTPMMGKCA